jgi:hypothetical protein
MLVLIQSTRKRGGTHWLQEGKLKKNLLLFYKIVNKEAPGYLYELVPPLVAANVNYNLRNSHNIQVSFNRLSVPKFLLSMYYSSMEFFGSNYYKSSYVSLF